MGPHAGFARRGIGEGAWQRVHVLVLRSLLVLLVHASTARPPCGLLARASLPAPKMLHRKCVTADADVNSQKSYYLKINCEQTIKPYFGKNAQHEDEKNVIKFCQGILYVE